MPKQYQPTVTIERLRDLAARCMKAKSKRGLIRILKRFRATLPRDVKRGTWSYYCERFIDALENGTRAFQVFKMKGNTNSLLISCFFGSGSDRGTERLGDVVVRFGIRDES